MRLIDADKLYPDRMTKDGLAISQSQIANAPTVEERPHGEWIIRRDKRGKHIYSVCSRCNVAHLDTDFPNFCPNCGSDNRKRGEAE